MRKARPGDHLVICDRTGFTVYASETKKEWNKLRVKKNVFERRHPQDFVRGVPDRQNAPDPRPDSVLSFIGPLTTELTADASPGDITLTVETSERFASNDLVRVTNDLGDMELHTVFSVDSQTTITLVSGLKNAASSGNSVVNLTAISPSDAV